MKQLSRYVGRVVFAAIAVVLFVILSLDLISDLVDQLGNLRGNYDLKEAIIYVLLYVPSSCYDFIPLSALVGCLIGLGTLASSSELTVMRAAGVSVRQIVWVVFKPVLLVIICGSLLGEFVAPYTDQYADSRRALAQGHQRALQSEKGLWSKEGDEYIHINAVLPNGKLYGITRFSFDDDGRLLSSSFADAAIYQGDHWFEQDAQLSRFEGNRIQTSRLDSRIWHSELSPALLNVLVLKPDELPMKKLYDYSVYLEKQEVDASEYRLAFWQKALQPLATLSLVVIAISFILGPLRQVTMGFRVFVGVLVGLIFQTSQKLLGPTSIIMGFSPAYAVLVPILCCFIFGWILLRRAN
ncbi:LPS export ABC transporter permease LptG [Agaribacterium haliotis]|uniref:LPS export ABC transporter permease LptG n=1 Tax=Agaribacterium haliotis TaxID=2013869 RepID=UPI000BB53B96|nr:LPS export ABC transporter permease LptG [Agaribacterium haliotis]